MSKIIHCGECEKFAYEDADGYGVCLNTDEGCLCSDKCRLVPKKNFADFDLCCNEQCPKRHECKRYTTYKQGGWQFNHVMKGCANYSLLI